MTVPQATAAASWCIVIIDDSPDDRAEVRRLLFRGAERRYVFVEADTGAAGVHAVLSGSQMPDCVVLDFNLPDMDALDVLARLAGPDGLPVCPIVVLTGSNELKKGHMVLRAGAQDYIAKDGLTPLALTRILENSKERLAMARELLVQHETLQRTEQKLSEADRRKDEFIATLAHELRNPLAPIATGLQVLRLNKDGAPLILDIMERQVRQMTRLIDDLMEIARIKNGKMLMRPGRVLASALIKEAAEAALPLITAAQHTLQIDLPVDPIWLDVDRTRIVQVIGNLLNNSVKYSPNGSHITLAVLCEDDATVIRVTDTGLGIPADMLGQVFDMFAQVNNTLQRAQGGLGIGLALVKQIVQLHNGTVVAESAGPGRGSTFMIRLPTACALPEPVTGLAAETPVLPGARRILVVDDNVDGAEMLSMRLSMLGHTVRTVFSGEEALAVTESFNPEIVFLDLGLPRMSGYEVARQFRATPILQDALLVALTGWGSDGDRRKSRDAGFDLHLTKPVASSVVDTVLLQYVAADLRTQPCGL